MQCGGRGECDLGFCKCDPGWYGTDCSRRAAPDLGLDSGSIGDLDPGPSKLTARPWLKDVVMSKHYSTTALQYSSNASGSRSAAMGTGRVLSLEDTVLYGADLEDLDLDPDLDPAEGRRRRFHAVDGVNGSRLTSPSPSWRHQQRGSRSSKVRRRPLIYVYDLPPRFNAHLLQYKVLQGTQLREAHMIWEGIWGLLREIGCGSFCLSPFFCERSSCITGNLFVLTAGLPCAPPSGVY